MFKQREIVDVVFYNNGWHYDSTDFNVPIEGTRLPLNYPFKKYWISDDAPVYPETPNFSSLGPPNLKVNFKIGVQKGNLYDLSLIAPSIYRPLLVSKLKNGNYRIITFTGAVEKTIEELEYLRVPISMNGALMNTVNFEEEVSDSLLFNLQVIFDKSGMTDFRFHNPGQIYLLIKKHLNSSNEKFSRLVSAELVSYLQLQSRGVFNSKGIFNPAHSYLKDKTMILFFDLNLKVRYFGVGSLKGDLRGVYPFESPYEDLGIGFKESYEGQTKYIQQLSRTHSQQTPQDNFIDHIFTRL